MNDYDIIEKCESPGVTKFIHVNGMETTIKTVPTCSDEDKNKAVLFISCSVGCQQACKFCYLTTKKMPYKSISTDAVISACKAVIDAVDISDKYLKLSFMGMGEVMSSRINLFKICNRLFEHSFEKCLGIDGVDFGTSVPQSYNKEHIQEILNMNKWLGLYYKMGIKFNPANDYSQRTFVRMFISLHSINDDIRHEIMPKTSSMRNVNEFIGMFEDINIIFHVMLIEDVNDNGLHLVYMINEFQYGLYKENELRLLRFNKCNESPYNESSTFDNFTKEAKEKINYKFKYQISAGSEIKAACGQFVCKINK